MTILDVFTERNREPVTKSGAVILVLSLQTVQAARRLYESVFVFVEKGSKMNVAYFMVGILHYIVVAFGSVAYSAGFTRNSLSEDSTSLSLPQISAAVIFVCAWMAQCHAHWTLASLRRGKKSNVKYAIPMGGLYNWVSCPNFTAEVTMYGCYVAILGVDNTAGWFIFAWVVANQTAFGINSHAWYKEKFEDYPKHRRAIFPYLL